jgi:hypothetical protein
MATDTPETKQHAHDLLDQLGPSQLAAVVRLLETLVSPDEDGDTLSPAERQAVAEADEWLKHNQPIPHEEVLAELGLTMADWERMGQKPLSEDTLPEPPPRRNG